MKKKNYSKVELKALEIVSSTMICGSGNLHYDNVAISSGSVLPGSGSGSGSQPTPQSNIIYAD